MWLFTKYGFFSVVCARQGDGRNGRPVDRDRLMVRARLRSHLEALKERFGGLLGQCDIREFVGTDYAYRLFVDKANWAEVLVGLSDEIDYDNFKSKVARQQGREGEAYEEALHSIWSVMVTVHAPA